MSDVEHILTVHNELGEGPIWSVEEQALYWVDIMQGTYHRLDPSTGAHEVISVGIPIGVFALRTAGGFVMATKEGFALWEPATRNLRYLARPEEGRPYMRFNDGAVDCTGRFWAGSMNEDEAAPPAGTLYRLDPDGSVHSQLSPVAIPNGVGWSPDNTIMYFTDSPTRTIFAFDFDPTTSSIANRRPFVTTPGEKAVPDGLTVDAEGGVWSAYWGGAKIVRYDPTGKVERVVKVPALQPTSCVFGGPGLDELYITSASKGLTEAQKQAFPLSGDLFRLTTEIKGQVKYQFGG